MWPSSVNCLMGIKLPHVLYCEFRNLISYKQNHMKLWIRILMYFCMPCKFTTKYTRKRSVVNRSSYEKRIVNNVRVSLISTNSVRKHSLQ